MDYLVNIDGIFINVEDALNKIKITNKKEKKQYNYILLIISNNESKKDFKFFYINYYKNIENTLRLIFDNSFKYWKTNATDTIYIRKIKKYNKLYIISNNNFNPSVQWIMCYREDEEYYNNDYNSLNFFFRKKNKNKDNFFTKCIN